MFIESTSEPESNSEISAAITEEVNEPLAQQLDFLSMTQSTSSDPEVEQLTKLPETVTHVISKNGVDVYIVGTAHFSMESQEDVAKVSYYYYFFFASFLSRRIVIDIYFLFLLHF